MSICNRAVVLILFLGVFSGCVPIQPQVAEKKASLVIKKASLVIKKGEFIAPWDANSTQAAFTRSLGLYSVNGNIVASRGLGYTFNYPYENILSASKNVAIEIMATPFQNSKSKVRWKITIPSDWYDSFNPDIEVKLKTIAGS